jgi:PAS domain S-box-containing protein
MICDDAHDERSYRFLFENNPQPMWIYDVETLGFLAVNESAMWKYGYSQEEFLSLTLEDIRPPEDIPLLHQRLRDRENGAKPDICKHRAKNGDIIFVEKQSHDIVFAGRKARFSMINDITERLKAENAMKEGEARYRALADTTSSAIIFYKNNRILYVNKALTDLLGYTKEDFARMNIWDAIHPDHREMLQQRAVARMRGDEVPARYEIKVIDKWGNTHWADFGATVIELSGEKVIMATAVDITERQRVEQTLRDSEETFRTLMEATSAGIFFYRGDRFSFVNSAMEHITGYTKKELMENTVWQCVHPDQLAMVQERAAARQRGEQVPSRYDLKIITKQGDIRWLDLAVSPIELKGEKVLMCTVIDITERERTAERLRLSEKRFRALYDHNPLMCFSVNEQGIVQFVNEASVQQLGYTEDELVGAPVFNVFHHDDRERIARNFDMCLHGNGVTHSWEFRKIHKNGAVIHVSEVAQLVSDPEGKPMVLIVCEDITEHKHLEEQIRSSEELKARILEASQTGVLVISRDGRIVQANAEAERFYGLSNSQLAKFAVQDFVHRKFWENGSECPYDDFPVVKCLRTGTTQGPVTMGIRRLDESMTWAVFTVVPLLSAGETNGAVVTFLDITARKQMEEALREREAMQRALTETTTAAIFFYQHQRFPYVNHAMEALTGYSKEELHTMRFTAIVHPDHHELVRQRAIARQQGKEIPARYELKVRTKLGDVKWLDVAPSIVEIHGEKVLMGTAVDITERKQFEEELRRSEELTHRILEAVPGGIIEVAQDGKILQANLDAQGFYGISALEFLSTTADQLAAKNLWEDGSDFDAEDFPLVRCLRTGEEHAPITFGVRRGDGGISWGVFTAVPMLDISTGKTNGAVLTFLDITSRKHIEDALRESEERYRKFFEEDLTGDFIASRDGCILACNQAFATMFGFVSVEEAMYCNLNSVYGEQQNFTDLMILLSERRRVDYHECVARRRDGKPVFLIQNIIGLFDSSGTLIGAKGYLFDNTAHKQLEQRLQEAAKIEGLGRLAGGIAHDFNNLLGIILGYSERLAKSKEGKVVKDAAAIGTAAQRGANLVKQLLTFARKTDVSFEEMNVNAVVDELARLLKETFPRTIALELDLDPTLPLIIGDSNQIHQAVLNLCVNARDAMPSGGTLTLKTEIVEGGSLRGVYHEASATHYAGIVVSDTGSGISDEVRTKIFEPFFSTKARDRGTGLGLAVVYGIVNAHRGFIDVRSASGEGSSFELYFPIPPSPLEAQAGEVEQKPELPGGKETVLLVEDEELLRELVESLLQGKGYTVLIAADGEEAVEIFRAHQREVNLVLTDLGLPKVDGWSACKRMKALNPNVRIIVASGYLDPEAKQEMVNGGVHEFVHKPYLATELTSKVRDVLDRDIHSPLTQSAS